jgi:HlyD family type I secretion membrane fusion protein
LQAHLARMTAQQSGQAVITTPAEFANLAPEDRATADQAMATETQALRADRTEDAARHALLRQHAVEANQQIAGYQHQLDANQRQHALNDQELKGMQDLAAKGYAPMTRVLALQHTAASLEGDAGAQQAEMARLKSVSGESQLQILQGDNDKAQQDGEDIRKTQADLEQAQPQLQTAREHLEHTRVRAPVSGSIVGLTVNTVNGVVAPGEKLMEVVPDKLPLVVEAQIAPRDANDLKVGQATQVRFPALHSRKAPIIHGTLTRISADSVVDEKTGRAYFTADITVSPAELDRLSTAVGSDAALRPGMPVDVVAPTRKRTALEYWLEPLSQTLWRSFREQ